MLYTIVIFSLQASLFMLLYHPHDFILCSCSVYVNDKQQAEVSLTEMERLSQCEYTLDDLVEGEILNVFIKVWFN